VLVDIRDGEEHARERIPGSVNHPLSQLHEGKVREKGTAIVFHCKSGNRSSLNTGLLVKAARGTDAFIIDGGIEAWKAAGLPVEKNLQQPIELTRQVQIVTGATCLAASLLGHFVNPAFYAIPGIVGAALLLNGLTGSSAMNKLMRVMPWNRVHAA
jgi:rhodanese-related sulfurtransferase